jgi:(S)-2-hydroxyglutarate dehydrogenase
VYDYLIIGGGIVGLSTAWQLQQRKPDSSILLLEKESCLAMHQTGRNSGVVHAGIYYTPGSLKAKFCKNGREATVEFCHQHGIPVQECGKLIVASNDEEHEHLLALFDRANDNGLDVELLDASELHRREPNIIGTSAIFLRTTGITDFAAIASKFGQEFERLGGEIRLNSSVRNLQESSDAVTATLANGQEIPTRFLIACGGLMADRLAMMQGIDINFQVIPYRGEYYQLPPGKNDIVRHLIYPVPNPELPFLGIHLTRMIDGSVTVGPNALQGWKREGYGRVNINLRDVFAMILFPGFWNALRKNLKTGLREFRNSISKRGYLKQIHKYCPSIEIDDLLPYRTGVRAMAVQRDGTLVDDFLLVESPRSLHVCNAPSPAATSAIPIGAHVCDLVDLAVSTSSTASHK